MDSYHFVCGLKDLKLANKETIVTYFNSESYVTFIYHWQIFISKSSPILRRCTPRGRALMGEECLSSEQDAYSSVIRRPSVERQPGLLSYVKQLLKQTELQHFKSILREKLPLKLYFSLTRK